MKVNLGKNTFLTLLAGGAVVLIVALFLNYKATLQRSTGEQPSSQVEEQKIVITEGEETKDWNVFRHEEMGFSIKYPDDVIISQNRSEMVVFTKEEYWNRIAPPLAGLRIIKMRIDSNDPVAAISGMNHESGRVLTFQLAEVNNASGLRTTSIFDSNHNYFLTDVNQKGPVLRLDASSDLKEADISDFVLMLSTFRFER